MIRRDSYYALVALGMQNELLDPNGFFHRQGYLQLPPDDVSLVVQKVGQIAARMRAANRPVIHGYWSFRQDYLDCSFSQQWRRRGLEQQGAFVEGSHGARFVDGLEIGEEDFLLSLKSHSGFQFTHLDRILRNCGVETCIIVGGTLSGSVDDTTRQGAAHGYRMLLVSDAIYPLNSPHLETLMTRSDRIDSADLLELIGAEQIPLLGEPGREGAVVGRATASGEGVER
jgi:nicotinamidase-related amidase